MLVIYSLVYITNPVLVDPSVFWLSGALVGVGGSDPLVIGIPPFQPPHLTPGASQDSSKGGCSGNRV